MSNSRGIRQISINKKYYKMEEGAQPSSTSVSSLKSQHTQRTNFHPINLLHKAISYGDAVWQQMYTRLPQNINITPLLNLSIIIEDHLQNLVELCTSSDKYYKYPIDPIIKSLFEFYSTQELSLHQQHMLHRPITECFQFKSTPPLQSNNYYSSLPIPEVTESLSHTIPMTTEASSNDDTPNPAAKSFYVEDLAISEVSDIVRNQLDQDKQQMSNISQQPSIFQQPTQEPQASQHLRINLIRHQFARSTDMTTLKLFKSFILALCNADKDLTVLPFDSKKTTVYVNRQQ